MTAQERPAEPADRVDRMVTLAAQFAADRGLAVATGPAALAAARIAAERLVAGLPGEPG